MRALLALAVASLALLMPAGAVAPCLGGPQCDIQGSGIAGFLPPVAVLASGGTVTWSGLDSLPHVNVEGAVAGPDSCFTAIYIGELSASVSFAVEGSQLLATQDGVTKACASAVVVPGVAATLPYVCTLHALFMKGTLVVAAV